MYEIQFTARSGVDWAEAIEMIDAGTNEPLDQIANARVDIEVSDYDDRMILTATTADQTVRRPMAHVFQWRFPADQMRVLHHGTTYRVGCRVTTGGGTTELFSGTLAYLDGELR